MYFWDTQKLRDHYISTSQANCFLRRGYDSGSNEKFLSVDELKS